VQQLDIDGKEYKEDTDEMFTEMLSARCPGNLQ
jgi:hypothetical protein